MQLTSPSGGYVDLAALHRQCELLQQAHLSPRTEQAYAYESANFNRWCGRAGLPDFPASEETLSLYLAALFGQGRKISTVTLAASSIAYTHRKHGMASPYTATVREMLRGARRLRAEKPRQMLPITLQHLREMCRLLMADTAPIAARDRAILLVAFTTALRRTNVAELLLEDLAFRPDGFEVYIRREKQDRAGLGRQIAVPFGKHKVTCAVRAVEAWLTHRGRDNGPLFTRFTRMDPGSLEGISGERIGEIIKQNVRRIGLNPDLHSGHSTRAGFVTAAVIAGVPLPLIARQSGQTLGTLQRYVRPVEAFQTNACTALGL